MSPISSIKNIVFDLGGVLVDLDREACVRSFAEIGFPEAAGMLDPYKQSGIFLDLEEGTASPENIYEYVAARASQRVTPQMVDRALCTFLVDLPQYKLDMLLELRRRYRIFMLSNTNPIMFPYIVHRWFSDGGHTPQDYFDRMFLSYEMKLVKPDPAIFLRMAADGDMIPSETLFIDDGPANIEAAAALGFRTYPARAGEDFRGIFDDPG